MKTFTASLLFLQIAAASLSSYEIEPSVSFAAGYRTDHLQWTVSSLPSANVLTEEKWKGLHSFQIDGKIEASICDFFYLRGEADYGWINRGRKTFDEWDLEESISEAEEGWLKARTRGDVYDASFSAGYIIPPLCENFYWMALAGYGYHGQTLRDHGYQDSLHPFNFFEDVRSSYRFRWRGPFAGFYCAYGSGTYFSASLEYQYHWCDYQGKIKDNLIVEDMVEIQKNSHAHGHDLTLEIWSPEWKCTAIALKGNYKYFFAKHGTHNMEDQIFYMKHLSWSSLSLSLDLCHRF